MTRTSTDKFETDLYLRFKKNEKSLKRIMEFEKDLAKREKELLKRDMLQRQIEREEMEQDDISTSDEEVTDEEVTDDDEETEEYDDNEGDDTIYCLVCSKKYDDLNKRTGPNGDRSCHYCCEDCFRQCMKIQQIKKNCYTKQYTCFQCEGIHYFIPTLNEIKEEREKEKAKFEYNRNIQNNKQVKKKTCKEQTTDSGCGWFFILFITLMYVMYFGAPPENGRIK